VLDRFRCSPLLAQHVREVVVRVGESGSHAQDLGIVLAAAASLCRWVRTIDHFVVRVDVVGFRRAASA